MAKKSAVGMQGFSYRNALLINPNVKTLQTYTALSQADKGAVIALGNFDGLHLGHQAVIAKAKSAGIDYDVKAKPARKKASATKMEIVQAIAKAVDADAGELDGLVKAPASALSALLRNV